MLHPAQPDATRDHLTRLYQPATTVLLGRKNYQGFGGYWPPVAKDETADPRDRAFARWLDRLSITLCPELVGGGARLFEDGLPASSWRVAGDVLTSENGALRRFYDRVRE